MQAGKCKEYYGKTIYFTAVEVTIYFTAIEVNCQDNLAIRVK